MLTKRIIPCLDILNGRTVKGVNFLQLRDAGDPVSLAELDVPTRDSKVCQGTLLSRSQYLVDIDEWGYNDARAVPRGSTRYCCSAKSSGP